MIAAMVERCSKGAPNKLTSDRDVLGEVMKRLRRAGLVAEVQGDGVLAAKK
jgi:predicted methyltransferase